MVKSGGGKEGLFERGECPDEEEEMERATRKRGSVMGGMVGWHPRLSSNLGGRRLPPSLILRHRLMHQASHISPQAQQYGREKETERGGQ